MRRGQGLTEAVIIIALVAIASIGVIGLFGNDLRKLFGASSDSLAGDADVANRGRRSGALHEKKTLSNFGYNPAGTGNGPQ